MPHLRSVAVRLVAAAALSLGAGFALSGPASAAPVAAPVAIVRPCPIYALDGARIFRPCPPPCPIYLTAEGATLSVWCPPPPPCPYLTAPTTDQLVYCPLPER